MHRDEVLKLWRQRPFVPFRITTVVGETINVLHPRLMLVAGSMITVGQPHPNEPPPSAGDAVWLGIEDIASIEPIGAPVHIDDDQPRELPKFSHDELSRLKWQKPFHPFRITTIDNETFDILHPGLILVGRDDVTIGLPDPKKPPPAASELVWLGFEHIASADLIEAHA